MLRIDNTLLQEVGLAALPEAEKNSLLKHIYETLEMRVGIRLADQMSNEQLDEFERYFEAKDDAGAFKWLETNFPNYKDIVQEEFDKLKAEVSQSAPQILSASQNQTPGAAQPLPQQPQAQAAAPQQPYSAPPAPQYPYPPQPQAQPNSPVAYPPNPPQPPMPAYTQPAYPPQQPQPSQPPTPPPAPQYPPQQPQPSQPNPDEPPFPTEQPPAGPQSR
ncbi:MAG TPA: DUF5663 domain-containing protein [Candidatus Saccharimonadales bacterium]|nr:DUF5663 domain-containing protein [Candidatus Saccharimonadales bacterium]